MRFTTFLRFHSIFGRLALFAITAAFHRNSKIGKRLMIRTICQVLLACVSVMTVNLSMPATSRAALTIDSILLESEAIAGDDIKSFSETDFGFYNAFATYSVGLSEDYLASGVIDAEFFQSPLGPTLGLHLDALATAITSPGSTYFASVSGSAAINFTTNLDSRLFILDPLDGVTLTRISDNFPIFMTDGSFLQAGSYQLYAEMFASPVPSGESRDSAAGLITFQMIPEPTSLVLLALGSFALLRRPI